MSRVVVLGAGAIGSLFGARLARAGEAVLLVGRPAHVEAIRARGITIEGVGPDQLSVEAATSLQPGSSADVVLLTVKSFDLRSAASLLARALPPAPTALLGNGLGIEEIAGRELAAGGWAEPAREIVRAVHTVPATLLGPGRVRASGTGEVVLPDPATAGDARAAVMTVVELFTRAGFEVRTSRRFELELWRKAAVNAAINPVTATLGLPNGALRDGPPRAAAERLLAEAVEVAQRSGIPLELATARADLERVVRATAENRSSMLQDVERGRPTEVDAISGELLRRGAALGLELPATHRAVEEVLRTVRGRTEPAQR